MRFFPLLFVSAAGLLTLGVSQALSPTAHAQADPAAPALRVSVQSLHTKQTAYGMMLTGRIVNTGRQALTYPSAVCVFTDAADREVGRADGYLTAGPVEPGRSTDFRAMAAALPAFAKITLRLREAGKTVIVQPFDSRRTTVR